MITRQSTPEGDNPFYRFQLNGRNVARRYAQLAQIIHHLRTEPDKKLTVVYVNKLACRDFLKFAEGNHIAFETGPIERFGPDLVKQDIISFEVKELR